MARQTDSEATTSSSAAPADPLANGYREDWVLPRVGIAEAARRRWFIVLLAVIVGVAAAASVGLLRKPTYEASARLLVEQTNVGTPSNVQGVVAATQTLAAAYGRAATSAEVTDRVAKRVGLSGTEVRSRVQVSPIAQSPVVTVSATGSTAADAVELTNKLGASLSDYVKASNDPKPTPEKLLADFRASAIDASRAGTALGKASARFKRSPTPAKRRLLDEAEADQSAAQTRRDAFSERYRLAVANQPTAELHFLNQASGASSDRVRTLQVLIFGGFVAGLALGLALAVLQSNRQLRRSLT